MRLTDGEFGSFYKFNEARRARELMNELFAIAKREGKFDAELNVGEEEKEKEKEKGKEKEKEKERGDD